MPESSTNYLSPVRGSLRPYDWGIKQVRGPKKNSKIVQGVAQIIERYDPAILVIEDPTAGVTRRSKRIGRLYRLLAHQAVSRGVIVHPVSQEDVRRRFQDFGATTKHEMAQVIAAQVPAFAHRMPRRRKAWMSEDERMSLFEAAALGMEHYTQQLDAGG